MIMKLSKYHLKKCEKFADDQLKGSAKLYAYRGESSKLKMREDIIIGKLAEVGACKYFKSRNQTLLFMKEVRSHIVQT